MGTHFCSVTRRVLPYSCHFMARGIGLYWRLIFNHVALLHPLHLLCDRSLNNSPEAQPLSQEVSGVRNVSMEVG